MRAFVRSSTWQFRFSPGPRKIAGREIYSGVSALLSVTPLPWPPCPGKQPRSSNRAFLPIPDAPSGGGEGKHPCSFEGASPQPSPSGAPTLLARLRLPGLQEGYLAHRTWKAPSGWRQPGSFLLAHPWELSPTGCRQPGSVAGLTEGSAVQRQAGPLIY